MVAIDGVQVREPERLCETNARISVGDETFSPVETLYLAYHKRTDEECSHNPSSHTSVFSVFPGRFLRRGLECAGRLDADTTGLLLFSDNGKFIHHVISPKKGLTKTYLATLSDPLSPENRRQLLDGLVLKGDKDAVRALSLEAAGDQWKIVVTEGRYHLIKRMFGACSNRVTRLARTAIGDLTVDTLAPGQWRQLNEEELCSLGWNRR